MDDNELQCSNAVKTLGKYGHEVITAPSAEEALLLLGQHAFDLAVVDWQLPGGADGLFLTSRICHEHPEVPVIVISGESRELKPEAEKAGARRFLPKPYTAKELNDTCLEVVAEVRAEAEESGSAAQESEARAAGLKKKARTGTLRQRTDEVERDQILEILEAVNGNRELAAERLGISDTTLWRKMRRLGITFKPSCG